MFKPDQPIQSYKEDILGRHYFAQSLGDAILNYKEIESVVIGLFGAWGSGKTSIVNMCLEHIEKTDTGKMPIIVKFNPWTYSDQNQLITQFFKQLSTVLQRADHAQDAVSVGEKLETYAKFFEPLSLVPALGQYTTIIASLLKSTGVASKSWGKFASKGVDAIRAELDSLLKKQTNKILVIIDDIDRLNNLEIRQVFQLIKSLGDFPNTIYLLAFDKDIVVNALSKVQEGSGLGYLEKMLQIPFEIPAISSKEIEQLFFSQLNEMIKDIPEDKWDATYWGNIYYSGLKYYFKNIRDVTRYINTLRFGFELVKEEIDPIDFIAITAFQVFLPDVYCGIRDNKTLYTGVDDSYRQSDTSKDRNRQQCDLILNSAPESLQEPTKELLTRLFPKIESYYGNMSYGYDWLGRWRKEGRVCSPDVFDVYFRFSIPKDEISRREMEDILCLAEDAVLFENALITLNSEGRIVRFLERIEDYTKTDVKEQNIENIITVLMNIGDCFPVGNPDFLELGTSTRIMRIILQLFRRFDSNETRFMILKNSILAANQSLHVAVDIVTVLGREHGKYKNEANAKPKESLTVSMEQLVILETITCEKIEAFAKENRLIDNDNLPFILYRWKDWGNGDTINRFVNSVIESDKGLLRFITTFLRRSTSQGISDYVAKVYWKIYLQNVEEFISISEAEVRVRRIALSAELNEFSEQEKTAIQAFLDAYDGKTDE